MSNKLSNFIDSFKSTTFITLFGTTCFLITTNVIYKWINQKNYFKRLNIDQGPTPLPYVGNMLTLIRKGFAYADLEWSLKYGRVFGIHEGTRAVIMIADPKLLKSIMVKSFNSFRNRRRFEAIASKQPFKNFLTVLQDDEWKLVRSLVTKTFTSGKLKSMTSIMCLSCDNIIQYVDELVEKDDYFNSKEVFGCYTLDIISSCCFGVSINALNDPENVFMKKLKEIFNVTITMRILFFLMFPKLAEFLSSRGLIEIVRKEPFDYVQRVCEEIIKRRKNKEEFRDDFIQMMIEHESTSFEASDKNYLTKQLLTNNEIISQAILFLTAGYDTTSTTLVFTTYNLATHQEFQEKLCQEIDEVLDKYKGQIDFDMFNEMPYLDACIAESLRMYPPVVRIDRVANEDYEMNGIKIPKGSTVGIPVYAIHHDPLIYSEPEKFLPERFMGEEKQKRENETYLPFGNGPRNCLGMRFAMLEMKILLTKLLSKYTFEMSDKTPKKITLAKVGLTKPNEKILLKFKPRF